MVHGMYDIKIEVEIADCMVQTVCLNKTDYISSSKG